ncbi:uncharacterized protein LOC132283613 [Cornus florida]|uniref:uncharacterized protein LOC132283613 n=1 Tax=Cornus florida TaxID=4283 RepID=UPI0028A1989C|nr:uncharacterized protein LOC132283613 [Cornus florida]
MNTVEWQFEQMGAENIIVISRWQFLSYLYCAVRGHERSYCHVMAHVVDFSLKREKMYKFVSVRHVVIVSLAINLGLLWKFTNEGEVPEANVQRKTNVVRSSTSTGLTSVDEVKHQDMVEVVIGLDL